MTERLNDAQNAKADDEIGKSVESSPDFIEVSEDELIHADEDIASALAMLEGVEYSEDEANQVSANELEIPSEDAENQVDGDFEEKSNSGQKILIDLEEVRIQITRELEEKFQDQLLKAKKMILSQQQAIQNYEKQLEKEKTEFNNKIQVIQKQSDEFKEHWVRVSAEFQNYQKRSKSKLSEFVEFERINLIREFLPVIDDINRSLEHADSEFIRVNGIELILKKLMTVLEKWEVREIKALGEAFDPSIHDAIDRICDPGKPDNTVIGVYSSGYYLGGRILKPTKVIVNCLLNRKMESKDAESNSIQESEGTPSQIRDDKVEADGVNLLSSEGELASPDIAPANEEPSETA